jgi:hypothetical protein
MLQRDMPFPAEISKSLISLTQSRCSKTVHWTGK